MTYYLEINTDQLSQYFVIIYDDEKICQIIKIDSQRGGLCLCAFYTPYEAITNAKLNALKDAGCIIWEGLVIGCLFNKKLLALSDTLNRCYVKL